MRRKGLGSGKGKGYKNIIGKDSSVHSQSAKGIKQPMRMNEAKLDSMDKQKMCMNIPSKPPPPPNDLNDLLNKKFSEDLNKTLIKIQTDEGLKNELSFEGKTYQGDNDEIRRKFKKFLINKNEKRLNNEINKLNEIKKSEDFDEPLIITIEWKPSRMWGSNPKSFSNTGFEGESIGGCGYDKRSTALAQSLNNHLPLMKKLVEKIENELKNTKSDINKRELLGYGSGYGIIPSFEGGVGVSSHQKIIEGVGLKFEESSSGKNTDVYIIRK